MAPPSKKRRTHYKSRNGCQQCKQRHVKCDEQRPACLQCSMTARSCLYVRVKSNGSQVAAPVTPTAQSPPSCLVVQPEVRNAANPPGPALREVPQQSFDLSHLVLFHHVESGLMAPPNWHLAADKEGPQRLLHMVVTSALSTPYLMDAVLGFAALHLSTLASDFTSQRRYRLQAIHLQTRALALYNAACPEITEQNCKVLLLYSAFIGMHMLHETITSQTDSRELLDKFIQFTGLYHGVKVVINRAWYILRESELSSIVDEIEAADGLETSCESICHELSCFLTTIRDKLGPSSFQACQNAVQSLEWIFHQRSVLCAAAGQRIVLSWPVRMSAAYLQMLRERQPEALVIMAYWAILLHYERDFWLFGQGGRFLIDAISDYLGPYWDKWLTFPREIVNSDSV
ncbi:hypothetical protein F5Y07DRAFT_301536 [Xylaria sp. FL0933]|nr:hypothetical protein F5Y07DRAFT_301536 [Xylaria sp. FL0933]